MYALVVLVWAALSVHPVSDDPECAGCSTLPSWQHDVDGLDLVKWHVPSQVMARCFASRAACAGAVWLCQALGSCCAGQLGLWSF